jgi:GH24 family phage-related lysozyme (muramidase)
MLKYDEFILEEEMNIDIDKIINIIKDNINKISKNKIEIIKYLDQVIDYVYKLPKKIRISILILVIPIFSFYISSNDIFNKIDVSDRLEIKNELNMDKKFTLSQDGWDFIKDHEKLRLKAYNIGDGKITIGWGHAEDIDKSKYKEGDPITKSEAKKIIKEDMKRAADGIRRILDSWRDQGIQVKLNQNQFDVLVSLAFNCGVQAVRNSDFIQEIKMGNFEKAGELIKVFNIDDNYPGLKIRRKMESELFSK